jgi:hypothetical protein
MKPAPAELRTLRLRIADRGLRILGGHNPARSASAWEAGQSELPPSESAIRNSQSAIA